MQTAGMTSQALIAKLSLLPIPLQSERLLLRGALPNDAVALHACYFGSHEASRFLSRGPHESSLHTATFLNQWCTQNWHVPTNAVAWVIANRLSGAPMGIFLALAKGHAVEIHYGIGSSYCGHGYATEAGAAVINWLLSNPAVQRVWTAIDTEHHASRRVLEKLGFQSEGVLRQWAVLPQISEFARDAVSYSRVRIDCSEPTHPYRRHPHSHEPQPR